MELGLALKKIFTKIKPEQHKSRYNPSDPGELIYVANLGDDPSTLASFTHDIQVEERS